MFGPTMAPNSSPPPCAWIAAVGSQTAYIEPGSPWENGYCESFNCKLRDELLNGEMFFSLAEAQVMIEAWRRHFNTIRPHSSLGYRPPAPEAIIPRGTTIAPSATAPPDRNARARPPRTCRQKPPCTNIETGSPLGGRPASAGAPAFDRRSRSDKRRLRASRSPRCSGPPVTEHMRQ